MQKKAEAALYEQEKAAAAAIAKSEAEKTAKENDAAGQKALAEATRAQGAAEASAIAAKLSAEAEGLAKKAEAMKQYGDAAKMQMELDALKVLFTQLPEMARAAAEPWSKVGNVTLYGGEGKGGEMLTGNITKTITQVASGL